MSHGGPPRPRWRAWLVGAVSLAACATPPSPARSPAPLDARALSETGLTEDEALLIALAALAPSRHNEQPWTVRVERALSLDGLARSLAQARSRRRERPGSRGLAGSVSVEPRGRGRRRGARMRCRVGRGRGSGGASFRAPASVSRRTARRPGDAPRADADRCARRARRRGPRGARRGDAGTLPRPRHAGARAPRRGHARRRARPARSRGGARGSRRDGSAGATTTRSTGATGTPCAAWASRAWPPSGSSACSDRAPCWIRRSGPGPSRRRSSSGVLPAIWYSRPSAGKDRRGGAAAMQRSFLLARELGVGFPPDGPGRRGGGIPPRSARCSAAASCSRSRAWGARMRPVRPPFAAPWRRSFREGANHEPVRQEANPVRHRERHARAGRSQRRPRALPRPVPVGGALRRRELRPARVRGDQLRAASHLLQLPKADVDAAIASGKRILSGSTCSRATSRRSARSSSTSGPIWWSAICASRCTPAPSSPACHTPISSTPSGARTRSVSDSRLPEHPIVQIVSIEKAERYFPMALPQVFSHFAKPVNQLRKAAPKLAEVGSLLP